MLDRIIDYSLGNRLLILFLFGILCCLGAWRLSNLPVDAFPDTTPVQVQINTVAPALNPEEVEQQITLQLELSIGGLPGLVNVRSVSKFGFSQVVATFADGTDITDARQYVSERISSVNLPDGIEAPGLGPISTGLGEIFHYIVTSDSPERTLEELRTIHDWVIKPELRKVPGVAEINSWGGEVRQYHVVVSPEALLKYGLTLDEVFVALDRNNQNVGGGMITSGGVSQMVHGSGRVNNLDELRNIVVANYGGNPVYVRDIAEEVKIDHEIRRGSVTANGRGEVVLGLAFMLMGENGQVVTEQLKKQLDEQVRPALPDDVVVQVVYDRTELTQAVIGTVKHNLIFGAALVIFVLFVLLGNLRAGLIVAVVIPLAMLFAALGMYEFSIAASLLSLGAIDFGIIIDGSVVMTEANLRRLRKRSAELGRELSRKERLEVVRSSGKQVARPIAFGIGIILVVFLPVLTLEGIEGKMFKPMAWTFIFALLGALIIALTLSPVLGYYFLPRRVAGKSTREGWMVRTYGYFLSGAMKQRAWVLGAVALLVCLSIWQATRLGGEFIPRLSEGAISVNTIRLAGISIDESNAYNTRIEQLILEAFPDEVRHVWSRVGTAEVATDPMGTELTDIFISLTDRSEWTQANSQTELVAAMQAELADLPGLNMVFTQPIEMRLNEMISGIRSDVGIKIYGDDFEELVRISDEIQLILLEIPGASDIAVDQLTGQPMLEVQVDQQALARYGVPARHVLEFVEAVGGRTVGEVFEGQRHFDLVVRLPDDHRSDPEVLKTTIVPTETGQLLPLNRLATVESTEGAATINREWGRRLIRVQCNIAGRAPSEFIAEARERIAREVTLPPGYIVEWGGQFENLERAQNRLMIVVPMTLLLVFVLLYFSMRQLRDVLLIYTGIPFALIGGVYALWLRGMPFSVSAAIGFVALSGIAVLNGQILVTAVRSYLEEGRGVVDAVQNASLQRLRPVLATALTDAAGFLPMAISTGVGAEVQRPLATVVIGGVITSTLLTLIVLPLLYTMFGRKSGDAGR